MLGPGLSFMLLAAVGAVGVPPVEAPPPFRYAAAVSFWHGKCRYWTGDVMFDASGFKDDLRSRFNPNRGITIFYDAAVPAWCVRKARRLARSAGFSNVRAEMGTVDLSVP